LIKILAHDFPTAADLYTAAIAKNPLDATIWCNRASARMKLEEFGYALADASTPHFQGFGNAV
jgi:serine/threonine-protein phosphatase 5